MSAWMSGASVTSRSIDTSDGAQPPAAAHSKRQRSAEISSTKDPSSLSNRAVGAIGGRYVRPSAERGLPERVAHEERAERGEVLRGLDGLAHGLHEVRERVQLAADQADDEVVVVDVEAVAGQADVVREVGVAVAAPQHAVLADHRPLLLRRQAPEGAVAAQRVPDAPRPRRRSEEHTS